MKKNFIFCFLISFSVQFVFAQVPTQAEIDKMMKNAQELMKKYGADTNVKKAMENQQPANNTVTTSLYSSDPGSYSNVDNWKFPAKNTALLSSLPKKVLTRVELVNFLNDVYSQLSKKLTPGVSASVQSIAAKYNNDDNKMGDAAVLGWYTDYREEALLLIIKAAAVNPDDGLLLNNCAALLNMSGIEHKAIPILKYVLQSYPGNSMLLNNLGQAYAGLGETDTAMVYFGRCMKIEPGHPEACGTVGQIEASKGNTEKAIEYLEKAIKSAYTKTAELKLRKIKKGSKIVPLIRPRVKLPEYFNLFKYDLPAQCISTDDAVRADAEHDAFRKMLMKQAQKYGAAYGELAQKKMQQGMQIMKANGTGRKLNKTEFIAQPYHELCTIMARDVLSDYTKELNEFNKKEIKQYSLEMSVMESKYQAELKIIKDGFAKREEGCGDGKPNTNCPTDEEKCEAYNKLANQYLPQFAYLTVELQKKGKLIFSTYFDELVYWHYLSLHPISNDDFRMQYYVFIEQYLVMMGGLCQTKIIKPCIFNKITTTKDSNAIKDFDCPIDVELGIGIGKIQLSCEKFSITGGEGIIFGYKKDFKTKQSTLSVGIGVKFDLGFKAGPAKAMVGAKATESVFITFDGNNGIADFGLENEAKLTGHVTGVIKESVSVGSKLGIQSGWNFNPGPLKNVL